jgi:hypothetical protein
VDRDEISANLTRFYEFAGKSVLYVGAGGGQLLRPTSRVGSVVAIDRDAPSLQEFRGESRTKWAGIPVRFVPRKFETVDLRGDVVYFEFCLYQMEDQRGSRARQIAGTWHRRHQSPALVQVGLLLGRGRDGAPEHQGNRIVQGEAQGAVLDRAAVRGVEGTRVQAVRRRGVQAARAGVEGDQGYTDRDGLRCLLALGVNRSHACYWLRNSSLISNLIYLPNVEWLAGTARAWTAS